jgi:hypothetical protein
MPQPDRAPAGGRRAADGVDQVRFNRALRIVNGQWSILKLPVSEFQSSFASKLRLPFLAALVHSELAYSQPQPPRRRSRTVGAKQVLPRKYAEPLSGVRGTPPHGISATICRSSTRRPAFRACVQSYVRPSPRAQSLATASSSDSCSNIDQANRRMALARRQGHASVAPLAQSTRSEDSR